MTSLSMPVSMPVSMSNTTSDIFIDIPELGDTLNVPSTPGTASKFTVLDYVPQEINSHVIVEYRGNMYVVMHVVKEKYGVYDFEYHDIIKQFTWKSNNGYFVTRITPEVKSAIPDLPFETGKEVKLDLLVLEYLANQPSPKTVDSKKKTHNYVIEHINNKTRDNRLCNLRWITVRHYDDVRHPKFYWKKVPKQLKDMGITTYPQYIKWLDPHNAFVIDDHPLKLLDHERDRCNKIRIFSTKAKAVTPFEKLCEIKGLLEELNTREYLSYPSFNAFCEHRSRLEHEHEEIMRLSMNYIRSLSPLAVPYPLPVSCDSININHT